MIRAVRLVFLGKHTHTHTLTHTHTHTHAHLARLPHHAKWTSPTHVQKLTHANVSTRFQQTLTVSLLSDFRQTRARRADKGHAIGYRSGLYRSTSRRRHIRKQTGQSEALARARKYSNRPIRSEFRNVLERCTFMDISKKTRPSSPRKLSRPYWKDQDGKGRDTWKGQGEMGGGRWLDRNCRAPFQRVH